MDRPPIVDKHVEDAQKSDQEASGPFCLESNSDHDTGSQSDNGDEHSGERPVSLEDESNEEEDEEDSTGQLEAIISMHTMRAQGGCPTHYFRRSVSLIEGNPANSFFLFWRESERTIKSPPTTLRLRRKKERSKRRP